MRVEEISGFIMSFFSPSVLVKQLIKAEEKLLLKGAECFCGVVAGR